jgi:hypothetical protein
MACSSRPGGHWKRSWTHAAQARPAHWLCPFVTAVGEPGPLVRSNAWRQPLPSKRCIVEGNLFQTLDENVDFTKTLDERLANRRLAWWT